MIRPLDQVKAINLDGPVATLQFLNCDIKVSTRYGGEVIASGCGSGKTTVVKDIIRQKFNEGILYAASTIHECEEMYNWCIYELVNKGVTANGIPLTINDIIVLHSKDEQGMEVFYNTPEDISHKMIVICTHHKLLHEYPDVLLSKSFDIRNFSSYGNQTRLRSSVTRRYTGNGSYILPRQWILIDEMPTCDIIETTFNKSITRSLMKESYTEQIGVDPVTGFPILISESISYSKYPTYTQMENSYNRNIKGTELDVIKGDRPIDKLRTKLQLETYYENMSYYNPNCEVKDVTIKYNVTDLILNGLDTRFWIFDGTGDLTFQDSIKFQVRRVTSGLRYSSPIQFTKIPIHIERRLTENHVMNRFNDVSVRLEANCDEIINCMMKNEKTLITVWKDLTIKYGDKDKRSYELMINGVNLNFSLPEYYTYVLCNKLGIPVPYKHDGSIDTLKVKFGNREFSIIHYQSGLDRATNEFRDYDSVMLFGQFMVPKSAVDKFNNKFECNCSHVNYTTYQLVQAICRTRIRMHQGLPINVYFTQDWDDKYIMWLNLYLTNNPYFDASTVNPNDPNLMIKSVMGGTKMIDDESYSFIKSNKWRPVVKLLCENYPGLKSAIMGGSLFQLSLTLDEIFSLIPMDRKKRDKYNSLIKYLSDKLNIELRIV